MTKLGMFFVRAFCHTTGINTIIQFVPNTPGHVFINTSNSCSDALLYIVYTYREWRNKNSVFDKSPTRRNHKALDTDILVVNMSVPCSGLLSGRSNVDAHGDWKNLPGDV
jgi:hypothetical protein